MTLPIHDPQAMSDLLREVCKRTGDGRKTRKDGFWVRHAWVVRAIAEQQPGVPILRIVKLVLNRAGLPLTNSNMNNLRVVYYNVRKKPLVKPEVVIEEFDIGTPAAVGDTAEQAEDDLEYFLDPELRAELEKELQNNE
jgi:hypothetical protein